MNDELRNLPTARALLEESSLLTNEKRDLAALQVNRNAMRLALSDFARTGHGEFLYLGALALQGIAVSALMTGRNVEGSTALATAQATISAGLKRWPDAKPLLELRDSVDELTRRVGANGSAYISDDAGAWPFLD